MSQLKIAAGLLVVLLCAANPCDLNAQTLLQPPALSTLHYHGKSIDFQDTTLYSPKTQSKFCLGFQWSGPNKATNVELPRKSGGENKVTSLSFNHKS